tara:strand:- start:212 stop:433 length:222 start_codon:yes stop_codon:yes gene_type:complete
MNRKMPNTINSPVNKWDMAYGEVKLEGTRYQVKLYRRNLKGDWVSLSGGNYGSRDLAHKQLDFALDIMGDYKP